MHKIVKIKNFIVRNQKYVFISVLAVMAIHSEHVTRKQLEELENQNDNVA